MIKRRSLKLVLIYFVLQINKVNKRISFLRTIDSSDFEESALLDLQCIKLQQLREKLLQGIDCQLFDGSAKCDHPTKRVFALISDNVEADDEPVVPAAAAATTPRCLNPTDTALPRTQSAVSAQSSCPPKATAAPPPPPLEAHAGQIAGPRPAAPIAQSNAADADCRRPAPFEPAFPLFPPSSSSASSPADADPFHLDWPHW